MVTKSVGRSMFAPVLVLVALVLAACVTINVYFPAVAAERAADRIIQDVWGEQPTSDDGAGSGQGSPPLAVRMLNHLVAPAAAQSPDLDISSPAIRSLTASMEQRHGDLRVHYESGAIGLTNDGRITVRDQNAIPLADRNRVRQLVADENADRLALYRQIAVANNRPEWEGDIRDTFADRWIANARSGWYYQDDSGDWQRK